MSSSSTTPASSGRAVGGTVRARSLQGGRDVTEPRRRRNVAANGRFVVPLVFVALAACTGRSAQPSGDVSATPPTDLKIAYLENLTPEGAFDRAVPAFYGAKMALDEELMSGDLPIEVEIVPQDIGDPGRMAEVLAEDAADPSYIGAMVSPFWSEPRGVGERLSAAGIPTISLSAVNPDGSSWRSWYAAVAPLREQAAEVAERLSASKAGARGVCLATDGSGYSDAFVRAVGRSASVRVVDRNTIPTEEAMPAPVLRSIRASGCAALVYGGSGSDAGLIRIELDASGLENVRLIGSDAMQDHTFLEVTGPSGDGTIASCSCVELGAVPSLLGQQFIHDYQSEYGAPPATYAVEGWDVARIFASAVRSGSRTRSSVADEIAGRASFPGLVHSYSFTRSGQLSPSARVVDVSTAEGGRWLPADANRS